MNISLIADWGALGSAISGLFAVLSSVAIYLVWRQLKDTKKIAQTQFEDALSREYRELISRIPTNSRNEQVNLRMRERIGLDVWTDWREGIRANLALPAFAKAWEQIKSKTKSFDELRALEKERFLSDPARWLKR